MCNGVERFRQVRADTLCGGFRDDQFGVMTLQVLEFLESRVKFLIGNCGGGKNPVAIVVLVQCFNEFSNSIDRVWLVRR